MLLGTVEHFYPRLHLCRRNPWPHLKPASCNTGSPVRLHELGSLPRCAHDVHARRHIPAERAEVVDGEFLNAAEGLDLLIDGSVGHPGALSRAWTVAHAGGAAAGAKGARSRPDKRAEPAHHILVHVCLFWQPDSLRRLHLMDLRKLASDVAAKLETADLSVDEERDLLSQKVKITREIQATLQHFGTVILP